MSLEGISYSTCITGAGEPKMDLENHVEDIRRKLETNSSSSSNYSLNQEDLDFMRDIITTSCKVWSLMKNHPELRDKIHFPETLQNTNNNLVDAKPKLAYMCEYCDSEIVLLNNDLDFSYEMHRQSDEHMETVSNFALLESHRTKVNDVLRDQSPPNHDSDELKNVTMLMRNQIADSQTTQAGTSLDSSDAHDSLNNFPTDSIFEQPSILTVAHVGNSTWYFLEVETSSIPSNAIENYGIIAGSFVSASRICSLCRVPVPHKGFPKHLVGRCHQKLAINMLAESQEWVEIKNELDLNHFTSRKFSESIWSKIQILRKHQLTRIFVQFLVPPQRPNRRRHCTYQVGKLIFEL